MEKGIALQFKLAFPANYLAPLTLHGGAKGTYLPLVSQTGRLERLENRKAIRTNRRYSYPISLTFEFRIDAFQKSAQFFKITFGYKLDSSFMLYNLHSLTGTQI
jgi:hypothetical protein